MKAIVNEIVKTRTQVELDMPYYGIRIVPAIYKNARYYYFLAIKYEDQTFYVTQISATKPKPNDETVFEFTEMELHTEAIQVSEYVDGDVMMPDEVYALINSHIKVTKEQFYEMLLMWETV